MLRRSTGLVLALALALMVPGAPATAGEVQEQIHTFLSSLPADFETIPCKTLATKQEVGEDIFMLDVREPDEFRAGHIEGAVNIPIRALARNLDKLPADTATPIAVVCKSGIRAAYATMTLKLLGYTNVKDVVGGMLTWEREGLPVAR